MDLLSALAVFVRVAETHSFSAVARERSASQSAISRQITSLEDELGVRLLHRTTRSLILTEDGQETLDHARAVLQAVAVTRDAAGRRRASPAGTVRLAVPVLLGSVIASQVPVLLQRHPALSLQLVTGDAGHDMVVEGLDLWLRVGESTHATEMTRRLGDTRPLLVASPAYLEAHGEPQHPLELTAHDCIVQRRLGADHLWHFTGPEGEVTVPVAGRFGADNAEAVLRAARAGAGIALVVDPLAMADLQTGRLQRVMPDYAPVGSPITLVYPSRQNMAPRVRAVIDFIMQDVLARFPQLAGEVDAAPRPASPRRAAPVPVA